MSKLQLPRPAGKQPAAAQPQPERPQVPLLETDPAKGLTAEQAAQRMAAGLDNHAAASPTRSETEIIRDNIFTFFNLVFIVLALCLALVGSFANMTFLGVVIANTIIGTVQQLRSKRTVDQLTLVAAHKVRCLRDGKSILLPSEELVRDDIVEFTSGEQICADAVVCTGSAQANEALITGEAEPVPKNVGDVLRSGSFLVSGRCTVRLTHVGAESYASKLATEAREGGHKVAKGEMMRSLDGLIRVIGIALIPMGVVMFLKQYVSLELPLRDSVEATVAALIGIFLGPILANRMGKKNVYLLCIVISIIFTALRLIDVRSMTLIYISSLCGGIAGGCLQPLNTSIQADNTTYVQYKTGKRAEAAIASLTSFITKVAQGLGGAIPGYVLAAFGFVEGSVQQPESINTGIILCVLILPMILTGLGAILFGTQYTLDKKAVEEMHASLAEGKQE